MKTYVYKMQWLLSLNGDFSQTQAEARKRVNQFVDVIGAQSLTVVYFRDEDLKIVDSYTNMVSYSTPEKANKALKQLIKSIQGTSNIKYVEFLRK